MREIKPFPSIIAFGYVQRVYPNTHCSGIGKSKGLQWVLSDATHCSGTDKSIGLQWIFSVSMVDFVSNHIPHT
jgi:hypothetical protein